MTALEYLNEAATPGQWFAGHWGGQCHKKHSHSGRGGADPCVYEPVRYDGPENGIATEDGRSVLASSYDGFEMLPANVEFVVALVNAFRSGKLVER
jgi:hypothetical protein